MKNCSSILTVVNHRNWLDDSPPPLKGQDEAPGVCGKQVAA